MYRETLIYDAEYFLTPYNNQSAFFEILLKEDSKNV